MYRVLTFLRFRKVQCPLHDQVGRYNPVKHTDELETKTGSSREGLQQCSTKNEEQEKKQDTFQKNRGRIKQSPHTFLEALGWGTAIVLGLQFGPLRRQDNQCGFGLPRRCPMAQWPPIVAHSMPGYGLIKKVADSGLPSSIATSSQLSTPKSITPESGIVNSVYKDVTEGTPDNSVKQADSSAKDADLIELGNSLLSLSESYVSAMQSLAGAELAADGQHKEAFVTFQYAAESGNKDAMYNIGLSYELGLGTKQDYKKAARYYQKAARHGQRAAAYNLAVFLWEGTGVQQDQKKALYWFTQAAQAGLKQAQTFVGVHFVEVGKYDDALPFLRPAADQEDSEAEYYLAVCYEQGWGVHRDPCTAVEYFSKSAKAGNARAMYSLASYYETGEVVGQKPELATELYQMAADAGLEEAKEKLEELSKKAGILPHVEEPPLSSPGLHQLSHSCSTPNLQINTSLFPDSLPFNNFYPSVFKSFSIANFLELCTPGGRSLEADRLIFR